MDTDEREMNDDSPFYEGGWGDLGLIQTVYTRSQRRRGRDVYSFAFVPWKGKIIKVNPEPGSPRRFAAREDVREDLVFVVAFFLKYPCRARELLINITRVGVIYIQGCNFIKLVRCDPPEMCQPGTFNSENMSKIRQI